MEKTEGRSKVLVRIEFLDSPHYQKIIGQFLKNSGEPKALVMSAVSSQLLALALSNYGNATRPELECIARKCRREMLNHVSNLDDFFALKYQINLQSDRPLNEHSSNISSPLSTDEDEEDDDDDDCKVEDLNPQVVIDF
jgi:hypothetical protein